MDPSLSQNHPQFPPWFSPESGVYSSLHPPRTLPRDPFTDLVSFIFSHADRHSAASAVALVEAASGVSLSYQRLQELVFSLAAGVHRHFAVSKGHLVLLLLPNSVLFPVVLLTALSLGAVVVVMNPQSTREEIEKHLGGRNLSLAFASPENTNKVDAFGAPVVPVPGEGFRQLLSGDFREVPRPAIRQSDTAVILYSSGTSGRSKGVILTHANLIAMVELFVRFEALQNERDGCRNVYLAAIPMFHVYGLSLFAIGLLSAGSKVVVMSRFDVGAAMKAIDGFGVTHFPLVPPILVALIRASGGGGGGGATGSKLSSLVQVSCGAAPLTKKVIEEFLKAFPHVDLIQGYGMTESTAIGTRGFNGKKKLKKYTSVGLLAPNMQAKVVDCKTGSCLPPGESGELWLRGPGIMKGYLDDEKATLSGVDEYGWLRTGDIAHFDIDGFMYIKDRMKDTIKYKGFQIAPADLEAVLISHPAIVDAAVASEEDEEAGEIPVAFVVRAPGSTISSGELIQYVANKVAPYKKIRKVMFVQSIPRSAAGKTLRRLLKNHQGVGSSSRL